MMAPEVKVGQLWADNDIRSFPRTIRVMEIIGDKAEVKVVTPAKFARNEGARTRISLKRFRANSTGYRLVEGVA